MAYASLSDLRAYLNVTGTGEDVLLTGFLARAQAIIDGYTHRTFEAAADTTQAFPVEEADGRSLWFTDADLCAVTTVVNADGVTIPSTEYRFEPPRLGPPYFGLTFKSLSNYTWGSIWSSDASISITGRWAFSTTAPADIQQAAVRLAAWLYRQRDNTTDVEMLRITPQGFPLVPPTLPTDVKAILDLRRRQ